MMGKMGSCTKEAPWTNAPLSGGKKRSDSDTLLPFLQRINLFGHFHTATRKNPAHHQVDGTTTETSRNNSKVECSNSGRGGQQEWRSVQSLRQFWNSQILLRGSARSEEELRQSRDLTDGEKTFRPVDNFNKYKTASSVLQNQKRQTIDTAYLARPSIAFLKQNNTLDGGGKIPKGSSATVGAGAKIHWARREDIFEARRTKMNTPKPSNTTTVMIENKDENVANIATDKEVCGTVDDKRDRVECRSSGSLSGSSVSLATTVESSPRRGVACRKVSFKTHSGQSHNIRKMATMGGSKVAALTYRFNQLIQQDSGILEEVKRKGVVVHRMAGHVYKIKEESPLTEKENKCMRKSSVRIVENSSADEKSPRKVTISRRRPSVNRKGSMCGSRLNSRNAEASVSGNVQATIKLFEPQSDQVQSREDERRGVKPKVPDKSEQVLLRTKEIQRKRLKFNDDKMSDSVSDEPNDRFTIARKIDELDEIREVIEEKSGASAEELINSMVDSKSENKQEECVDVPEKVLYDYDIPPSPVKFPQSPNAVTNMATLPKIKHKEKSVYGRLYEKIKFKSSFLYTKKHQREHKQPLSTSHGNLILDTGEIDGNPDQKIVDALCQVNEKIDILSKSSSDLTTFTLTTDPSLSDIKPNDSFLFRTTSRNSIGDLTIDPIPEMESVQAINHHLINRTQSMDDSIFPQISIAPNQSSLYDDDNIKTTLKDCDKTEDDYEIINPPAENDEDGHPREALYQTLSEVRSGSESVNSYESFDNYEAIDELRKEVTTRDAGYEVCLPPEPPPPRKPSNTQIKDLIIEPPMSTSTPSQENIYDTIKNGDRTPSILNGGYERITRNCYESISSTSRQDYLRLHMLRHSDSVSTLSSDHKTNSLYGTSINGHSLRQAPSEGSSDNSDEWIDISDSEDATKYNFIIIRERTKCHRSPDWSRKVRDHRIQQHENLYCNDSDHHYESLYSTKANEPLPIRSNHTNGDIQATLAGNMEKEQPDDDFDSFDSDPDSDDDIKKNDSGVDVSNTKLPEPPPSSNQVYALMQKFKNLSSLSEISKSLSRFTKRKSPKGRGEGATPGSKYENTKFYDAPEYQNVSFDGTVRKSKSPKSQKRGSLVQKSDDAYENTEFHTPCAATLGHNLQQQSSLDIKESKAEGEVVDEVPVKVARKKSKSGKSFKSKLRRSLVSSESTLNIGSSFNGTRSTFYISDSVDMDSGIFTGSDRTLKTDESMMNQSQNSIQEGGKDNRRKSTPCGRPLNPPPPPPASSAVDRKKITSSTTSWYAECGVFKSDTLKLESKSRDKKLNSNRSTTSWYAEAGLYQTTSGDSVASSSGSSGVSTGGECGGGDDNSHSMFLNEPLYQIYSAAKLESISRDIELGEQDQSDGYEEIGKKDDELEMEEKKPLRPTALQLVGPKQGPSRTLWSEIPEVINSEILSTLTATEKRLQEAKFEILTSEASYLKSLNLLKSHFMNDPSFRDATVLSSADRKTLFSYTIPVQECSDRLLCDLENCWQDNIMLLGLSHSVYKHAEKYFHVYVQYCEHQVRLDRTLRRLKDINRNFTQALDILEADPVCCGLSLHSFLMLPMQRITRLPLLIDAVLSKLKMDDDEYDSWKMTLAILNKIVAQCNEAANRSEQAYEMQYISRQIEFPTSISPFPIVPMGIPPPNGLARTLVRRGELTHLIWRGDDGKLTFGKKFSKTNIYAFLFTDLLVLTKKKNDENYLVFDHCPRSMLTVSSGDVIPQLPTRDVALAGKHLILMTLLENHEGKTVELILSCQSETDRQRWLQATEPPLSDNPDETLYEQWDCPQVIVRHEYQATQPDELSLDPGDIVNVTRKMADGWYHGERIRDGAHGWFPGNYTEEVASPHVRARNLKQRYRLLTFTATYLEAQKKK
ncbi:LOW QUALITY PROTEIN: rho guanine nucleotide exchange factor 16 [Sergentomyia squamirostris]